MGEVLDRTDLLVTVSSTAALEALHRRIPTALLTDLGVREALGNHHFTGSGCLASWDQLDAGHLPKADEEWVARQGVAADGTYDTAFDTARARVTGLTGADRLPPLAPTTASPPPPAICRASSPATTSPPTGRRCPAHPPPARSPAPSGRSCAAPPVAPTGTECSAWRPSSGGWASCERPYPSRRPDDQPGSGHSGTGPPRPRRDPRPWRLQGSARQEPRPGRRRAPRGPHRPRVPRHPARHGRRGLHRRRRDRRRGPRGGSRGRPAAGRHRRRQVELRGGRTARTRRPRGPPGRSGRRGAPRPVHQPLHRPRGHRRRRQRDRREGRRHGPDRRPLPRFRVARRR